ncbi:MAG: hypothetical protein ACI85O_003934 [Saprospiraceae bacterium]|jgi:hypothetical protein
MKKLVLLCLAVIFVFNVQAQDDKATLEALKTELAAKKTVAAAAAGEAAVIQAKIDALPGWRIGGLGILGANFAGSNQWFGNAVPNSESTGINFALSGFANQIQPKYFWRNSGSLNIGALKFKDTDIVYDAANPEPVLSVVSDAIQVTSLYGYRLNDKIAISTLGDFRTLFLGTSLKDNVADSLATGFLNPGYLDLGIGVTWTPIKDFVAVIHPINQNWVFSKGDYNFDSSLGAKIVLDYTKALPMGVAWKSNLSAFYSYKGEGEAGQNLHNYTWTNGVSFTAWKGIGVTAQLALRQNQQEALNLGKIPVTDDNPVQVNYIIGLSYSL